MTLENGGFLKNMLLIKKEAKHYVWLLSYWHNLMGPF